MISDPSKFSLSQGWNICIPQYLIPLVDLSWCHISSIATGVKGTQMAARSLLQKSKLHLWSLDGCDWRTFS